MNHRLLISVIIPFLNAERFLEEAIESVVGQSYAEWELLLVDDGSTDSSTEIALRYAESISATGALLSARRASKSRIESFTQCGHKQSERRIHCIS